MSEFSEKPLSEFSEKPLSEFSEKDFTNEWTNGLISRSTGSLWNTVYRISSDKGKRSEHTWEHTCHKSISGQIFSAFLLTPPIGGYALPNSKEAQRFLLQDPCKYRLLGLTLEVIHNITTGENEHWWQRDCNWITDVIMNLGHINKLVIFWFVKTSHDQEGEMQIHLP